MEGRRATRQIDRLERRRRWPRTVTTMKAIVQDELRPAPEDVLRLAEIDRPAIGDGEVLRAGARGRRGPGHLAHHGRPAVPGAAGRLRAARARRTESGAGRSPARVEAVGADVTGLRVGDEVFGIGDGSLRRVRAAPGRTSSRRKPANLTFEQAAAVPVSGAHRPAGRARPTARVQAGQQGADHRRVRRRRHVRRADRQGVRRRGHRRVQHRRRSTWSAPSAPTTSSTTPARTSPTAARATT